MKLNIYIYILYIYYKYIYTQKSKKEPNKQTTSNKRTKKRKETSPIRKIEIEKEGKDSTRMGKGFACVYIIYKIYKNIYI